MDSRGKRLTGLLLVAWLVAFVGAFVAFAVTPAKDFGLAAGWNKVGVFMGWQAAAGAIALICAMASRRVAQGSRLRWLGLVPLGALALLIAAVLALIIWANFSRPGPLPPPPDTPATTVPAKPVSPSADGG